MVEFFNSIYKKNNEMKSYYQLIEMNNVYQDLMVLQNQSITVNSLAHLNIIINRSFDFYFFVIEIHIPTAFILFVHVGEAVVYATSFHVYVDGR